LVGSASEVKNLGASSRVSELPLDALALDRTSDEPMPRQIYHALRKLILRRSLSPGLRLPSTRSMAKDIGVSRNTVMAAYELLASEGYLETRQRARAHVVDLAIPVAGAERAEVYQDGNLARGGRIMRFNRPLHPAEGQIGLRPSTPDVRHFPFKVWKRLMLPYFGPGSTNNLLYNHSAGLPSLQAAIANYVQAYRGVNCRPENVVITNGAQGALDVISRLLLDDGDRVWMEEPGYHGAQGVFVAAGAKLVPLAVDREGWGFDRLPPEDVRLIYTSPSCQFPLGQTMRMEQRMRLLEIAKTKNAWIIEDDFDSEYRSTGISIPAMQGLDTSGRTIYVGTFSKTLFPGLRVGFMVLPESLRADTEEALSVSGHFVGLPLQATLSDFINHGHFARHVRRMRKLYATRRRLFLNLADMHLGQWIEPFESDVGIQLPFHLKLSLDDRAVARLANERRLNVTPLSIHFLGNTKVNGFVLGYAALDERAMEYYLAEFAKVFHDLDVA
jgi:GntR family transcriptional regulator/MocR family aminotransferase